VSAAGMHDEPTAAEVDAWFREHRRTEDRALRNRLVEHHRHLADYFVRRYSHRGVPADDLRQIALLAIVHAVQRFDPENGASFSTFAGRTIDGELKRWFRDRTWAIRPPRRTQELHLELRRADEELSHRLGRAPTVPELAAHLGVDVDQVLEALEAGGSYQWVSWEAPAGDEEGAVRSERVLAQAEGGYASTDHRMLIADLLDALPEREREIVELRFFEELSQPEIAERVGVSRSYLSRVLRRTLIELRERARE
jgi:RNA polymerase sigma-B factor